MLKEEHKQQLLKAINAEKKLNLSNKGVLGGFNKFFLNFFDKISDSHIFSFKDALNRYESLAKSEKFKLLKDIENWIEKGKIPETKEKRQNPVIVTSKKESITNIPGVGKQRTKELKKLGLESIEDILYYVPRRYEDRSQLKPINLLESGSVETIFGTIKKVEVINPKKNVNIFKAYLKNASGCIAAIWFNQTFLKNKLKPGIKIIVTGKVDLRFERKIIVSEYEIYDDLSEQRHTGRIVPIYSTTEKIPSKFLRNIVYEALDKFIISIPEVIPEDILKKYNLLGIQKALKEIHFPTNWELAKSARNRLAFEELLILQLGIKNMKQKVKKLAGISHTKQDDLAKSFINSLPFPLTNAQLRVISEIKKDMENSEIMYRLVQGDVGSGKTVVAIWALIKALSGGYQGALMVPTEILAEQHYLSITKMLKPLGIEPILLTGSLPTKEKKQILYEILQGNIKLVIGTHALIQDEVIFNNLGVVVIDEQHRFGVKQRLALQEKGPNPDILIMTATPIPRSLALTLYGDMDLSIIDELPQGRKPVKTYHINEAMRTRVYNLIRKEVTDGHQVYFVCPMIEESEKLYVENVINLAKNLQKNIFPEFKIGLLHGKLDMAEKEKVMENFRKGFINILVTTTVIEVGVNVPNATIMVIENAERFGLAQLHQLRGRVGRGSKQAYCILISDPKTDEGKARMEIMTESTDGFYLSEQDLKLRGPGDFLGTKQHGLPDLKIANLLKDVHILEQVKILADEILREDFTSIKYNKLYEATMRKFNNYSSENIRA
jgi:ATP-dependent DNA helicase RecG